jgi:glycolate oxidase
MGGSVAECAGGLRGLKYGVTRHYVLGMESFWPRGEIFRFGGKTVKNSPPTIRLPLHSSEGTLGIITQITVKPSRLPNTEGHAGDVSAARKRRKHGDGHHKAHIIPATLEIMDRVTIQTVESYAKFGLPTDAEALSPDRGGRRYADWWMPRRSRAERHR